MPRARNIKPGFFKNEELVELPFEFRLLFIGLWTLADRAGRLEDRPKRIKMEIFPADNVDVDAGLEELERSGFIERYQVADSRVISVVNFVKHQSPHHTEKASDLPGRGALDSGEVTGASPLKHGEGTVKSRNHLRGNPPDSLNPDSLIPDSLNPESCTPPDQRPDDDAAPPFELSPESPTPKKNTSSRGTRLPTDWQLPADWLAWALSEFTGATEEQVQAVAERFRDYWLAKTGANATKADWSATWRNWCRRESEGGRFNDQSPTATAFPTRMERVASNNRDSVSKARNMVFGNSQERIEQQNREALANWRPPELRGGSTKQERVEARNRAAVAEFLATSNDSGEAQ